MGAADIRLRMATQDDAQTVASIITTVSEGVIEYLLGDLFPGMTPEKIQEYFYEEPRNNPDGEHIGIYNIRIRMAYLFGDQYELSAKGIETGGLYINFSFPERLS